VDIYSLISTTSLSSELDLLLKLNFSIDLDAIACCLSPLKYLTPCLSLSLDLVKKHLKVERSYSIFRLDINGNSHLHRATSYTRVLLKPNSFIHRIRVSVSGRAFN
jgi:hypothetical protein